MDRRPCEALGAAATPDFMHRTSERGASNGWSEDVVGRRAQLPRAPRCPVADSARQLLQKCPGPWRPGDIEGQRPKTRLERELESEEEAATSLGVDGPNDCRQGFCGGSKAQSKTVGQWDPSRG